MAAAGIFSRRFKKQEHAMATRSKVRLFLVFWLFCSQRRARFGWPAAFYIAAGFAAFGAFAWLAVNPGRALEPSLPSQAGF
jgi:hypothetical protein